MTFEDWKKRRRIELATVNKQLTQLIVRIKEGSQAAREEFAVLLRPHLRQVALKFYTDPDEIDSTINWVIVKLLSNIYRFDDKYAPMGYIYRAIYNYCVDEYRRSTARLKREETYATSRTNKDYLEMDVNFFLEETLGEKAAVIIDKFINNKDIREIASHTGYSMTKVKNILYTGEVSCREALLN